MVCIALSPLDSYSHQRRLLQSNLALVGLGIAAVGFAGRYIMRQAPGMAQKLAEAVKTLPTSESFATSKYYKGGFDPKMNKREAALILGVSPTASKTKVRLKNSMDVMPAGAHIFLAFKYFRSRMPTRRLCWQTIQIAAAHPILRQRSMRQKTSWTVASECHGTGFWVFVCWCK